MSEIQAYLTENNAQLEKWRWLCKIVKDFLKNQFFLVPVKFADLPKGSF